MATPPTLVAVSTVASSVSNGASITSGSLTVQTGDVVTILAGSEGNGNTNIFSTPTTTITNSGIVALKNHQAASDPDGGSWTFTATASGSGTVNVVHAASPGSAQCVLMVLVHRGATAATAARSALGTGSSRTTSYTPSQVDSAIVWMVLDWAAAAVQTVTPTSTSHTTTTPGPSALPSSTAQGTNYTWYNSVLDDQTSAAAVSYGIGGTGTGPFTILVVEVQGVAAGPDPGWGNYMLEDGSGDILLEDGSYLLLDTAAAAPVASRVRTLSRWR